MATGGPPQSQLSLGSCDVEEKRSTCCPLGLDMTLRETEAMLPADLGRASRLYTPSTPDDLSCYEELQDQPKLRTTSLAMEHRRRQTSRKLKPGAQLQMHICTWNR